jgi:multisubunit Na+/H+ antiporter MnhE subunit
MKRKILIGNISIDMIIALSLFVILFASYLGLGDSWIRDMVNLILGTIIGALKVSMTTHIEKEDEKQDLEEIDPEAIKEIENKDN